MSVSYQAARTEDLPQFFTIHGLASAFGISPAAIYKYKAWGHVDPALSHRPDGFNYDMRHYRQVAAVRAKLEKRQKLHLSHGPKHQAHCIIVHRGAPQEAAV